MQDLLFLLCGCSFSSDFVAVMFLPDIILLFSPSIFLLPVYFSFSTFPKEKKKKKPDWSGLSGGDLKMHFKILEMHIKVLKITIKVLKITIKILKINVKIL